MDIRTRLIFSEEERDDTQAPTPEVQAKRTHSTARHHQRKSIQKRYAARVRHRAAAREAKKGGRFVRKHPKGAIILGVLFLTAAILFSGFTSLFTLLEGGGSVVAASTYPCEDADMLGAEAAYCDLETQLQSDLDSYEDTHNYDEYHYDLDEIEHDPYVLISMLTAWQQGEWALAEVGDVLQMFFDRQYTLTETVTVEMRGGTEEDEEPEPYYICTVALENFNLSHLPVYLMDEDRLAMYATYMGTLGNRPDLFPDSVYIEKYGGAAYTNYEISPEALEDEQFAAMMAEATKYLGYPYVWGGSTPATSFDCSGFVSWVINHTGWDVGRLGATSLYGICTPISAASVRPGDLVFFQGTFDAPGMTHVGIYVGDSMMLHCGDPIQYANLNTSYWQAHFAAYGRLPQRRTNP